MERPRSLFWKPQLKSENENPVTREGSLSLSALRRGKKATEPAKESRIAEVMNIVVEFEEMATDVTDEDGARDTAERADGGEASDLAADAFDRLSENANDEWAGRGEKGKRNEKK